MTDDIDKKSKLFVSHTPERKEHLRTNPDAVAREEKRIENQEEAHEEFDKPSREFREKVCQLGDQMMDTMYHQDEEKRYPRSLYALNFQ